uniref:Uncharacterized protein n=1 Tax=Rhizophora mucronata TaxID=61149 RepID=A0A2P2PRV5_RHIMU
MLPSQPFLSWTCFKTYVHLPFQCQTVKSSALFFVISLEFPCTLSFLYISLCSLCRQ